jgi:hypothetical protein
MDSGHQQKFSRRRHGQTDVFRLYCPPLLGPKVVMHLQRVSIRSQEARWQTGKDRKVDQIYGKSFIV